MRRFRFKELKNLYSKMKSYYFLHETSLSNYNSIRIRNILNVNSGGGVFGNQRCNPGVYFSPISKRSKMTFQVSHDKVHIVLDGFDLLMQIIQKNKSHYQSPTDEEINNPELRNPNNYPFPFVNTIHALGYYFGMSDHYVSSAKLFELVNPENHDDVERYLNHKGEIVVNFDVDISRGIIVPSASIWTPENLRPLRPRSQVANYEDPFEFDNDNGWRNTILKINS